MTVTAPAPLRVSLFGYAPGPVEHLLSESEGRLGRLSERVDRDESALVAVVDELQRWKARARAAEATREDFERALTFAPARAAATIAEAEAHAAQIVQQARDGSERLVACARDEARHLVTCARVEARRAEAAERRELRARQAAIADAEERLAAETGALAADRARFEETEIRWRRKVAWLTAQLLSTLAPLPAALPAAGDVGPADAEAEAEADVDAEADDVDISAELMADPVVDRKFARFMSEDPEHDPWKQWTLPNWPADP